MLAWVVKVLHFGRMVIIVYQLVLPGLVWKLGMVFIQFFFAKKHFLMWMLWENVFSYWSAKKLQAASASNNGQSLFSLEFLAHDAKSNDVTFIKTKTKKGWDNMKHIFQEKKNNFLAMWQNWWRIIRFKKLGLGWFKKILVYCKLRYFNSHILIFGLYK
jgi:hypothetical protein